MHQFFIRAIGAPHTKWQMEALEDYIIRLSPYAKVSFQICEEGHQGSAKPDEVKTRSREADTLLSTLPANAYIIALDERGRNISSEQFSQTIKEYERQPIVFLLGGSWGLDERVRERAHFTLSMGKQTLPHILARIVLLEQLYRVETILQGKTYHK
ncbi:23S rRNA (pseudouridine(1915)-N(3))-methyltransferase RlmH [Patescibacteria group bacterium]|nr:23S rRNA (pseudouridine(1915)-N(3))-methyltransferase RlmH [Patescibacteria group bacterium]